MARSCNLRVDLCDGISRSTKPLHGLNAPAAKRLHGEGHGLAHGLLRALFQLFQASLERPPGKRQETDARITVETTWFRKGDADEPALPGVNLCLVPDPANLSSIPGCSF